MVSTDNYWLAPAERATVVTKSDVTVIPATKRLYVGGTGDIKVTLAGQKDSQAVIFSAVPTGTLFSIQATKVWSTGTTATLMIALY